VRTNEYWIHAKAKKARPSETQASGSQATAHIKRKTEKKLSGREEERQEEITSDKA
jgi:hypothetical protein